MPGKQSSVVSILKDLTHLQIDTIIKSGMIASTPPDRVEEILSSLHWDYLCRVEIILRHNKLDFPLYKDAYPNFEQLYNLMLDLDQFMHTRDIRIDDSDYILLQRIYKFCKLIQNKQYAGLNLYTVDMATLEANQTEGEILASDLIKLKRYYDLGTEKVVMQTRIGIDGDIVSRIEEGFAKNPLPLLVDLHDKHTRLSMNYWNNLIKTAVNLVGGIFKTY